MIEQPVCSENELRCRSGQSLSGKCAAPDERNSSVETSRPPSEVQEVEPTLLGVDEYHSQTRSASNTCQLNLVAVLFFIGTSSTSTVQCSYRFISAPLCIICSIK